MTTCKEVRHYLNVREEGYASPEMIVTAREHIATCVSCGGTMPPHEDLQAIFRDMFTHVGHAEICKDETCKCRSYPPSQFEIETVKQFKKNE